MSATSRQTWWKALTPRREEARDAGRLVGRLDELDLHVPDREERDVHTVGRDRHDGPGREAERIPVEAERGVHLADDDGNVMDAADAGNARRRQSHKRRRDVASAGEFRGAGIVRRRHTVTSSRCSPQAARSRSESSPTVA
jgi:hypothetical protein